MGDSSKHPNPDLNEVVSYQCVLPKQYFVAQNKVIVRTAYKQESFTG